MKKCVLKKVGSFFLCLVLLGGLFGGHSFAEAPLQNFDATPVDSFVADIERMGISPEDTSYTRVMLATMLMVSLSDADADFRDAFSPSDRENSALGIAGPETTGEGTYYTFAISSKANNKSALILYSPSHSAMYFMADRAMDCSEMKDKLFGPTVDEYWIFEKEDLDFSDMLILLSSELKAETPAIPANSNSSSPRIIIDDVEKCLKMSFEDWTGGFDEGPDGKGNIQFTGTVSQLFDSIDVGGLATENREVYAFVYLIPIPSNQVNTFENLTLSKMQNDLRDYTKLPMGLLTMYTRLLIYGNFMALFAGDKGTEDYYGMETLLASKDSPQLVGDWEYVAQISHNDEKDADCVIIQAIWKGDTK